MNRKSKFNISTKVMCAVLLFCLVMLTGILTGNQLMAHQVETRINCPDALVLSHAKNDDVSITQLSSREIDDNRLRIIISHDVSVNGCEIEVGRYLKDIYGVSSICGWIASDEIHNNPLWNSLTFQQILDISIDFQAFNSQSSSISYQNVIRSFDDSEWVLMAMPIYQQESVTTFIPNDSYYAQYQQSYMRRIGIEDAWSLSRGKDHVTVGIMEGGSVSNHIDFIDKDGVSRLLAGNNNHAATEHATAVAGVIGAVSDNKEGIAGIAQVNLSSLCSQDIPKSLTFAAQNNIPIVNASFVRISRNSVTGIGEPHKHNAGDFAAIQRFAGLFVAGVGNGTYIRSYLECGIEYRWDWDGIGVDNDITPHFPASYRLPNVISVGSVNSQNDNRATHSNFGKNNLDIFAPGTFIASMFVRNGAALYSWFSGTSFATPIVSGTAALMLSVNPHLTAEQLKQLIIKNADIPDINGTNPLDGLASSNGRINVHAAVHEAAITPAVGRHRTGGNAHLSGSQDFYFIDRFIGYSWNAYIALPDINSMADKLFPGVNITGATLRFDFSSNRNDPDLRAQVRNTNNPSYLRNAPLIMNLNVNHPTGVRTGTATVNVLQHLNTSASSGGIGIISLYDNHNPFWYCGHQVTFSDIRLELQFTNVPIPNSEVINIAPNQFGFINQYHFTQSNTSHTFGNQFAVNVRRQRTAYNPDEDFIVLSSNRENVCSIHGAFFEFNPVGRSIRRLEVQLGLWSGAEFNNSIGVEIYLWYRDSNGVWRRHTNLQALNLPLRSNPRNVIFNFREGTQGFRIQVRVDNPQGTQNRGRIVVGNMKIHTPHL